MNKYKTKFKILQLIQDCSSFSLFDSYIIAGCKNHEARNVHHHGCSGFSIFTTPFQGIGDPARTYTCVLAQTTHYLVDSFLFALMFCVKLGIFPACVETPWIGLPPA
jgi:hypothetical protein